MMPEKTYTAARIAQILFRHGAKKPGRFTPGAVVRLRDGNILIRHCSELTGEPTREQRELALAHYKNILAAQEIPTDDFRTQWGEPALIVRTSIPDLHRRSIPDPDPAWAVVYEIRTLHRRQFNGDYENISWLNASYQTIATGHTDEEALADRERRRQQKQEEQRRAETSRRLREHWAREEQSDA